MLQAGRLPEAQRQLEVVLAATPDDAQARRQLVMVLSSRQQGTALAAELEAAVKGDANDLDLRMDLGAAYMALGRKAEAAAAYEEVLRRRPRHPGALKLAGDLARERGDVKSAATNYARLHALAPHDPRPVFLMAAAYAQAGDLDRAQRWFDEAAQLPGMMGEAYANLGAIALRRGDPRQALWYLSRAVRRRPDRATIRYNHALALHLLARDGEALDELRVAADADPADAGVRFFAGVVALALGKLDEATESFKAAVELDPGFDDARDNLALLERRRSRRSCGRQSDGNAVDALSGFSRRSGQPGSSRRRGKRAGRSPRRRRPAGRRPAARTARGGPRACGRGPSSARRCCQARARRW